MISVQIDVTRCFFAEWKKDHLAFLSAMLRSLKNEFFLNNVFIGISVCPASGDSRSQNCASSSSTETGLPNARCSSLVLPLVLLLSFPLARDFRSRGSGSDVAKDEGERDIGGKGTVGATESAESGAELPPSSRGPLRIESGDPLDCSACISVAILVAVVVLVVVEPSGRSLDLDLVGGGLLSSGTVEVRRKVVLWPWLSPRVPSVSLAGFARDRGVQVASIKRGTFENVKVSASR